MNLHELGLVQAAAAIRDGELSPVEYTNALLGHIDSIEPSLQAWVTIDRDLALTDAQACEIEARQKRFRGPLHGVPVGIKDVFFTRGLRTTMGSRLFKDFVPDVDAASVANLRRAGAIVLGKTVTTQFAYIDPGPTANPWNPRHTPGGSSSGSSAAVAARMCPAATGSQTVGSIGRPASFNGIVAMMPSQERISTQNMFPDAWSLDHIGGFTRSVADLSIFLEAMAGRPIERSAAPAPVRIGVIRGFFFTNASEEMRASIDRLADRLADADFHIDEAGLPDIFEIALPTLRTILRAEMAAVHRDLYAKTPDAYDPKLRAVVETGLLMDATVYLRALRIRRQYQQEMARLFDGFDVLLTPGARGTAPEGLASTGDSVMQLPWALADFPTLSLPHAIGANGLPMGIQITAPHLQDGLLLEIGKRVEDVISFQQRPHIHV